MKKLAFIVLSIIIITSGCVKDRKQGAVVVPPVVSDTLMYFWNFNNADSSNHAPDVAVNTGAKFSYYSAYIDYIDGSVLNLQAGADSGMALRVRNPSDSLVFHMPTTGFDSVTFSFAERRSNSGPPLNTITYTVDGVNYINTAIGSNSYSVDTLFAKYNYILSSDPQINNNPKFAIKIQFTSGNTGTSGNDRFDNVCLKGKRR